MSTTTFEARLSPTHDLRERATRDLHRGAVTEGYGSDLDVVIEQLNIALATELVCGLRYRRHHFLAEGLRSEAVADEFLEHAIEEQAHADRLAKRIVQLGGTPNLDPATLAERSHAEFGAATDLEGMLRENLVAERIAIESYGELIRFLGDGDPTTRRMIEDILATEEEHADELAGLLKSSRPKGI